MSFKKCEDCGKQFFALKEDHEKCRGCYWCCMRMSCSSSEKKSGRKDFTTRKSNLRNMEKQLMKEQEDLIASQRKKVADKKNNCLIAERKYESAVSALELATSRVQPADDHVQRRQRELIEEEEKLESMLSSLASPSESPAPARRTFPTPISPVSSKRFFTPSFSSAASKRFPEASSSAPARKKLKPNTSSTCKAETVVIEIFSSDDDEDDDWDTFSIRGTRASSGAAGAGVPGGIPDS